MAGHFADTRRPGAGPGGQVAQSGQRTHVLVASPGFHAQAAGMRVRHLRIDQRPAPIAQPSCKRRQRQARRAGFARIHAVAAEHVPERQPEQAADQPLAELTAAVGDSLKAWNDGQLDAAK